MEYRRCPIPKNRFRFGKAFQYKKERGGHVDLKPFGNQKDTLITFPRGGACLAGKRSSANFWPRHQHNNQTFQKKTSKTTQNKHQTAQDIHKRWIY